MRLAPTSWASSSVTDRLSPSAVSQLLVRSRPVTITRSPLARESARCSACPRQTLTRKNEVSPSRHWPSCWMRWVTATRRLATAVPELAAEMAAQVGPAGRVIGLDISDSMLALSRQRCGDLATSKSPSFLKADAARLHFADSKFDVAVSTQVYEYVPDVPAALAEVYRVLRPGGRVLILDTDWDSIVWAAGDQDRMQRVLEAWADRFADPHLPRSLPWQLQRAGFQVERRDILVLFNPEYDPDTYSVANGQIMADFAVTPGRMRREEAEAWMHDLQRLGSQGRYFFSLNRYLFLATMRS